MKLRHRISIIALMIVTVFLLTGCGIPAEGADVTTQDPDGWWQTFFVWPLALSLIWMDELIQGWGIPYHWGFAIIAFTILIKVVTFPLTLTQIRGMKAQREIQPKVQALQKKYGDDREKLAQEQMKLYKEAGVNPLSGCLPLIVQMPILFGLYSALVALGPNITDAKFFWIPDLGFPRYTHGLSWIAEDFNNGDYLHLAAYLVLPVILVISQYSVQKWMTPAPTGDESSQAAMTRQIGTMMTFMFGFFTLQVPAGLSLYWVTSNLLQVVQQLIIGRDTGEPSGVGGQYASAANDSAVEASRSPNGSNSEATNSSKKPTAESKGTKSSRRGKRRSKRKR